MRLSIRQFYNIIPINPQNVAFQLVHYHFCLFCMSLYSNGITVHIIIICRVGLFVSVWNLLKCKFIYQFEMFVSLREEWFAGKIKKCDNFMENKTITIPPMLKSMLTIPTAKTTRKSTMLPRTEFQVWSTMGELRTEALV